jgi:hypothetical protein
MIDELPINISDNPISNTALGLFLSILVLMFFDLLHQL